LKINIIRTYVVFLFIFQIAYLVNAQDDKDRARHGWAVEIKAHYGFLMRHHPEMEILTDRHFPAYEITLTKQFCGIKQWEQLYNFPELGISYLQSSFGNSELLGMARALYPFIRFPLIKKEQHFGLNVRFGVGLGHFSKKFDVVENYKNLAIGSQFNAYINMMVEADYKIGSRFRISSGISLTHFSSGAMSLPNYGLNIPSVNLGLTYNLRTVRKSAVWQEFPELDRSWDYILIVSYGIKEANSLDNKKYSVYSVSADILKPLKHTFKLGGGLDVFYDNSKIYTLSGKGIYDTEMNSNLSLGIHLTYEQTISHLSILIELGTYLISKHNPDGTIYEKLILNYYFLPKVFGSVALKAHYGKADYITWGIGYKF